MPRQNPWFPHMHRVVTTRLAPRESRPRRRESSPRRRESSPRRRESNPRLRESSPRLSFHAVSVSVPHPDKLERHGEDASFANRRTLGVFDGVGSWIEDGIDSGEYSRKLSSLTQYYYYRDSERSMKSALHRAVERNHRPGTSTACVLEVNHNRLRGTNVGDSGMRQIRDGREVYRTPEGSHGFNAPHQVGYNRVTDLALAHKIDTSLREGDVVVIASDGLWDNVFNEEVVQKVGVHTERWEHIECDHTMEDPTVYTRLFQHAVRSARVTEQDEEAIPSGSRVLELALDLASAACTAAHSKNLHSPFKQKADEAGIQVNRGGKLDDITIVVALAVSSPAKFSLKVESVCPTCID